MRKRWWIIALRGALGVAFGCAAFAWPHVTLDALIMLFGAYVLADGLAAALLVAVREDPVHRSRLALLLEAFAGVAAGLITFLWPAMTEMILLALVAFWALLTGLLELVAASSLPSARGTLLLRLCGLVSVALGVAVLLRPAAGLVALTWLVGAYALVFGALLVSFGLWLHNSDPSRPSPLTADG